MMLSVSLPPRLWAVVSLAVSTSAVAGLTDPEDAKVITEAVQRAVRDIEC